jgi:hypothetical protein
MRIYKKNIIVILTISLLSSCEKIIDLNLDTAAGGIVIVGNVFDRPGATEVKISKTVDFTETNNFPPVRSAIVTIKDSNGHSILLTETNPGSYTTSSLKGVPGVIYTLTVDVNGKTYTATSKMPNPVIINAIFVKKSTTGNEKEISLNFKDPEDTDNYYRIIEYINNILKSGINIGNDKLYQGEVINYSLGSNALDDETPLKTGDKVLVQLQSIDKDVFEYFRTSRGNDGQSASPANPVSNISNGALGYFSACSVREAMIIIP